MAADRGMPLPFASETPLSRRTEIVANPLETVRRIKSVMDATIELPEYYIEVQGSLVQRRLRSLKHGDAFVVFDDYGDIGVIGGGAEGLYFNDTRFLSWELSLNLGDGRGQAAAA